MVTALTFPLSNDIIGSLKINQVSFYQQVRTEYSGTQAGEIIVKQGRTPLWYAKIQTATRTNQEAYQAQALIDAMGESVETFYAYNPAAAYPWSDTDGTKLGSSSVTISALDADNKRMTLAGLPPSYVLTASDMLHFDYGTDGASRALHRIVQGGTADGTGNLQIEVRPFMRPGAATGASVTLIKPSAEMRIVPGTFTVQTTLDGSQITFEAVQVI